MAFRFEAYTNEQIAEAFFEGKVEPIKATARRSPIVFALGIIIVLGGVFLTLASHQILPQGPNMISQLGTIGHVVSYCIIGFGFILGIAGGVKTELAKREIESTTQLKVLPEITTKFNAILEKGEVFIVDTPSEKILRAYHCTEKGNVVTYDTSYAYSFADTTANLLDHTVKELVGARYVSLQAFKERVAALPT